MARAMSREEIEVRTRLATDFPYYSENCLKVLSKEGLIEPLKLNQSQMILHEIAEKQLRETGKIRIIVLKGRQQGISTYVEARFFWRTTNSEGQNTFILTHEEKATSNLFDMAKRYYDNCPDTFRPSIKRSNAKELNFGALNAKYSIGTAGARETGRGQTVRLFHGSEVAFWPKARSHTAGVMQGIPKGVKGRGTEVFLESTANGVGGDGEYFYQLWQEAVEGRNEFLAVFLPWFLDDDYRLPVPEGFKLDDDEKVYMEMYNLDMDQMVWRREKISEFGGDGDAEKLFKQEYPATAEEAFLASNDNVLVDPGSVHAARKREDVDGFGPVVIGVDIARYGKDKTAIVVRQGRQVIWYRAWPSTDLMEVTGLVYQRIRDFKPRRVFLDIDGLGAGVLDRLREMGYSELCTGVNSGSKALDAERFVNKRAEMCWRMREWFADEIVSIPDDKKFQQDLCSLLYKRDSKHRIQVERKEDAKKRGVKSPDLADALAMTFAFPVSLSSQESFEPGRGPASYGGSFEPA